MKGTAMLTNATLDGLHALRLPGMVRGLLEQREHPDYASLSFEERLALLVDRELTERRNRKLERGLKAARLRVPATIEDVDFRRHRGLERAQILTLAESHWVDAHHSIVIVGATGLGKTYLACALANAAIRRGHTGLYLRAPRLLNDVAIARAEGRLVRLLAAWARLEVLVIDDFLIRPLNPDQAADMLEVIEDRVALRATIVTSQLPVAMWHDALGEPTVAEGILDRLLENVHRIELHGEWFASDFAAEGPRGNDPRLVVSSITLRGASHVRAGSSSATEEVVGGDEVGDLLAGDRGRGHPSRRRPQVAGRCVDDHRDPPHGEGRRVGRLGSGCRADR
jgi:DNA replication protein DnaC